MKKLVSLALIVSLIFVLAVPVSAAEETAWTELLEYSTVNNSGSNWFRYTSTTTVSVPTPYSMRLTKIDLLITYPSGTAPTKVEVTYNGTYYPLEILIIDNNTARVYGSIQQNFYSDVRIRFTSSSTSVSYLEILSCRVSQIVTQEVQADAQVFVNNTYYPTGTSIEVPGNDVSDTASSLIRIEVYDWMKFDTLTIWGSASTLGLNSVRATLGTSGLPFEMSYIQTLATGESADYTYRYTYTENYSGGGGYGNGYGDINTAIEYNGKILYCITIDLTGVDRSYGYDGNSYPLVVYLTGVYTGTYGYTFNCQYVNGSIVVPDKTEVTWWNKFTAFMQGLFDPDEGQESIDDLNQGSASISQGASDIGSFEQSQQSVLDNNFATIQNAVTFTNFAAALVFVQKYANMTFDGISQYAIIFTLPLFLGLFFYLCSRIPGITRWKTPPPRSKGGGSP